MGHEFENDLVVIGGGAAGLTCSTGAGQLGAKTLLIEKEKELGGDCLHYGCVPSKSLIKSATVYNLLRQSQKYGLPDVNLPAVNFREIRDRIEKIIQTIQAHDSPEHIKDQYNVASLIGQPVFVDAHTISIDGEKITSKNFVIATGSSPVVPPIEGLKEAAYLTNKDIFYLDSLPESLIVLGGGPIGLEMAQSFARLGSKVSLVEFNDQVLPREDEDIAEVIKEKLVEEGVVIYTGYKAIKAEKNTDDVVIAIECLKDKAVKKLQAKKVLVATGRGANVQGLGLDNVGIEYSPGGIKVDRHLKTKQKNIYACGDVIGGYQFTHVAGYEGGLAMVNAVTHLPVQTDYSRVPWVTYLDPEIASVGYNEKRAKEQGLKYTLVREEFRNNDRALAEGESQGFIKLLVNPKGIPIGVQLVGFHAGDLLGEWVAVLNGKVSLSTIAQSIHAYPTLAEINKTASGNYLAPQFFSNPVIKWLSSL